jgi:hypothetical protein
MSSEPSSSSPELDRADLLLDVILRTIGQPLMGEQPLSLIVTVENQWGRPHDSARGAGKLMSDFGLIMGVLLCAKRTIPEFHPMALSLCSPAEWKCAIVPGFGGVTKQTCIDRARQLGGQFRDDEDGPAEAFLIALHGATKIFGDRSLSPLERAIQMTKGLRS